MIVRITPTSLSGTIKAPSSKSKAHRLLLCAALSDGPRYIGCETLSDDIDATTRCLNAMGARIIYKNGTFEVNPTDHVPRDACLYAGESGTTLRLLLPVVCALGLDASFYMGGRLPERPMEPLVAQLRKHGCTIEKASYRILRTSGRLKGGDFTIPGNISSQFISGLLFALPLIDEGGTISVKGLLESKGYVDMTLEALKSCGINIEIIDLSSQSKSSKDVKYIISGGQKYDLPKYTKVEGDWSNAAFWLSIGAMSQKGISCLGLKLNSSQKDKEILDLIRRFGAKVVTESDKQEAKKMPMRGILIDAGQIPDLVPILSVLAAASMGETRITHAERLRIKESDRLRSVSELISRLGGKIHEKDDGLIINGTGGLYGGTIDSFNDHRIAMSAAAASLISEHEVIIKNAQAVNKSYPEFWRDFEALGGQIKMEEDK